ncbi:MAG: RdgB/HAM1 family non-canonical purine NTP pyrophosphatase [Nitrososphaeraceae archaeon]
MNELYFVSGNIHKYLEIQSILENKAPDINLKFFKRNIIEIQEETIQKIALEKSKSAYNILKKPIIIEDDGLFIKSLNGFPGQYSSYVFRTIGNKGIIKLLKGQKEREAFFQAIIVYNNGLVNKIFTGQSNGIISTKITSGGWGYDPIFIPHKKDVTFATLNNNNKKNQFSHRRIALDKLLKWLKKTK